MPSKLYGMMVSTSWIWRPVLLPRYCWNFELKVKSFNQNEVVFSKFHFSRVKIKIYLSSLPSEVLITRSNEIISSCRSPESWRLFSHFSTLNADSFVTNASLYFHSIFLRCRQDYLMICLPFPLESVPWAPCGWGFCVLSLWHLVECLICDRSELMIVNWVKWGMLWEGLYKYKVLCNNIFCVGLCIVQSSFTYIIHLLVFDLDLPSGPVKAVINIFILQTEFRVR